MWNLPRSGIEPVSPALAGGYFTTEPPGKPGILLKKKKKENSKESILELVPEQTGARVNDMCGALARDMQSYLVSYSGASCIMNLGGSCLVAASQGNAGLFLLCLLVNS